MEYSPTSSPWSFVNEEKLSFDDDVRFNDDFQLNEDARHQYKKDDVRPNKNSNVRQNFNNLRRHQDEFEEDYPREQSRAPPQTRDYRKDSSEFTAFVYHIDFELHNDYIKDWFHWYVPLKNFRINEKHNSNGELVSRFAFVTVSTKEEFAVLLSLNEKKVGKCKIGIRRKDNQNAKQSSRNARSRSRSPRMNQNQEPNPRFQKSRSTSPDREYSPSRIY